MTEPSVIGPRIEDAVIPGAIEDVYHETMMEEALRWSLSQLRRKFDFESWSDSELEEELVKHAEYLVETDNVERAL